MRLRALLAGGVIVALAATTLPGEFLSADLEAVAAPSRVGNTPPGVESLGPITVVAGSGPYLAELPPSVADLPAGKVFNPAFPYLHVPDRKDDASVAVQVFDVSAGSGARSGYVWQGTLVNGWVRIDKSLMAGHGYVVMGLNPEVGAWQVLGDFSVLPASKRSGPSASSGGISASVVTGEVQWSWASEGLPAPTDGVNVSLTWVARQEASVGLPRGWRLGMNVGSPWATLTEFGAAAAGKSAEEPTGCDAKASASAPVAVYLTGWDGSTLAFQRNDSGIYEQVTGGMRVPGFANTLTLCGGASKLWRFTDVDGNVTSFRGGHVVSVAAQDQPIATLEWDGDRLTSVTNASDRTMRFVYAGSGTCPSASWGAGFSAPPNGSLCQIRYPGEIATDIGYVSAGLASPQIALIKDPGNQGISLGWDSVGRLTSTRSALVNLAATADPAAKSVLARVEYDAKGRAAALKDAPARIDGDFITNRLEFPPINDTTVKSTDPLQATVRSVGGSFDTGITYWLDPVSYESQKTRDQARATTTSIVDEKTGQIVGSVDPLGRRTTYTIDDTGAMVSQQGPYIVNPSKPAARGMEQSVTYDTTERSGKQVAINGFKADVFADTRFVGDLIERQFIPSRGVDAGLEARLPDRTRGYSARLTARWTPTPADDKKAEDAGSKWDFELSMGTGVRATLIVGAQRCVGNPCTVDSLATGPKQVTIEVTDAPASGGWVRVKAAPAGSTPVQVPATQVEPGFQRATQIEFNDTYAGSSRTPTVTVGYANPAVEAPTSVTSPGGLVNTMSYEPSNPAADQWGRRLGSVSAGGMTQTTSYWADKGTVPMPTLCGVGDAFQSGQKRSVTRIDGTRITTYYDVRGRVISEVVTGDAGRSQTSCLAYYDDGTMRSGEVFNAQGALMERTTVDLFADGDPLTMRTTVLHGPAAPVDPGVSMTSTTTVNLHGLPVRYVDETGTVTTTTYTVLDDQASMTITPPKASAPTLTSSYEYRPEDGQLVRVMVNGVEAAKVSYQPGTGRVNDITYGGGRAAQALEYTPAGQPSGLVSSGGGYSVQQRATYTVFGRMSGLATYQTAPQRFTEERNYEYDSARRLTKVDVATSVGGAAPTPTNYRYDYAATQDASCGQVARDYPGAAADMLRTGGSRAGVRYVTCHDKQGRTVSTTDPLLSGDAAGRTSVTLTHDAGGRVRSIVGGARPLAFIWGTDTNLATVTEGSGASAVTTTLSRYGSRVVRKTVAGSDGTSTVRYAYSSSADVSPTIVLNDNGTTQLYTLGLPGGATVTTPIGGAATLQLSGLDGSALVTIPMPVFNARTSGASTAPATVGLAPRFGAYGEPLVTPSTSAGGSAAPIYAWQGASRQETLAGTFGITFLGARPYLPALGEFLAADPNFEASNNLYSFTPGDPINGSDNSGEANEWSWFWQIMSVVTVIASFAVGAIPGMGWLIPLGLGFAATAMQTLSFKTQEEPSPGLDVLRQVQFWGQTIATLAFVAFYAGKGVVAGVKWIGRKCGAKWAQTSKAAAAQPVASPRESISLSSRGSSNLDELLGLVDPVQTVTKVSRMQRFAEWVGKANPKSGWWRNADGTAIPGRSYLRSLGKLTGRLTVFGGGYGFQKWAEGWQPSTD